MQAARAVEPHQGAGNWRADEPGNRRGRHEHRGDGGAMIRWEPVAEVQNDSGEEAGFRDAEQKAEDTKADGAANKSSGDRDQAPGDHDAADPEARSDRSEERR